MSEKDPYRPRPFRPKKGEEKEVLEFLEIQDNLGDSIRYLIQKEIAENGVRNLQEYIPAKRNKEYFKNIKAIDNSKTTVIYKDILHEEKVLDMKNNMSNLDKLETVGELKDVEEEKELKDPIEFVEEDEEIPNCYL